MNRRLQSTEEMKECVREFMGTLAGSASAAVLVALSGELGAGKTTFTQMCAKELGVEERLTSPTFIILKSYDLPGDAPFKTLIHIDAYRLEDPDELRVLGFLELLKDPSNIIFLEWPERVLPLLPPSRIDIDLVHCGEECREITISCPSVL